MDCYKLIQHYLDNRLSPIQRQRFEQAMEQDPELRKEVALQERIDDMLYDSESLELKKELNQIHQMLYDKKKITREILLQRTSIFMRYAAILIFGILFIQARIIDRKSRHADQRCLISYYDTEVRLQERTRSPLPADSLLFGAQQAINQQEYELALESLQLALASDSSKIALLFKLGQTCMANQDYRQAAEWFRKASLSSSLFSQEAHFYFAGCLVLSGEQNRGMYQFSQIAMDNNHPRQLDAMHIFTNPDLKLTD